MRQGGHGILGCSEPPGGGPGDRCLQSAASGGADAVATPVAHPSGKQVLQSSH